MGKWLSALKWLVVAVVLAVFIGLLIKWNRKGGISVEAGFDDRIELTSQEIRRIEQIGQWDCRLQPIYKPKEKCRFFNGRILLLTA